MCLLNRVLSLLAGGKYLSMSCKKSCAMFVMTFLLKGELYQMVLRCLFRLGLFGIGLYVSCVSKLLCFRASL